MKILIKFTTWLFCSLLVTSSAYAQPLHLNFENVEIYTLISTVSQLTGKNFVVDPRVQGKVTVVSSKPLGIAEVYQVFLTVLEVHGYSAIPSGSVIQIVPNTKAKQGTIPTDDQTSGSQMVTQVIQVKNVSADQLTPILRPLMPQHAHLASYNATNMLIITDSADNVSRLLKIIKRVDHVSDSEVDLVPLRNASAPEIVRVLTNLQQTSLQGKSAQHLVRLAADERTNSVLLSGEHSARLRLRAIITHMDTPLDSGGNTKVVYLRYIKAKEMVPILTGVSTSIDKKKPQGGATGAPAMPINIQADESNNALVITAPPDVMVSLTQVIRQLDIRRAQVLIEAVIAEVSTDKARELGVQWAAGDKDSSGRGAYGTSNFNNASSGGIINLGSAIKSGVIPPIGNGLTAALGQLSGGKGNIGVLISALKDDAGTNILSTPSILTLDNQKAEIVVGQNVPFVTGSFSNNGANTGSVSPFQTIQRQDVGLTLRVTPQINEGDAIMLEVDQEVSSISPATVASDIVTNKRTIKTKVMVDNGSVIVLGGLIDEKLTQSKQRVPLLGDIPLLGKLFQYNRSSKEKRNLMVFLRPRIINDAATQADVTHGKYQYIRQQQLELRKKGIPLLPNDDSPLFEENISKHFSPINTPSTPIRKAPEEDQRVKTQSEPTTKGTTTKKVIRVPDQETETSTRSYNGDPTKDEITE